MEQNPIRELLDLVSTSWKGELLNDFIQWINCDSEFENALFSAERPFYFLCIRLLQMSRILLIVNIYL